MDRITDSELAQLYDWTSMALGYYEASDLNRRRQMSIKAVTLLVPKGKVLSTEIATIITKEFNSGYGLAIASDNKLEILRELGEGDAELLVGLIEDNKDANKLLWFCKSDNPLLEEDIQPFDLIEGEIVGCLTGDFSEYAQAGSSHTNESNALETLRKKMLKLWNSNDSKMETFAAAMEDETDDTLEQLHSFVPKENASIVYLTSTGLWYGASNPETREEKLGDADEPWGWSYGAPPMEKPASATHGTKAKLSLKKSSDTKPAEAPKSTLLSGRFVDVKTQKVRVGDADYPFELANKPDGASSIDVDGSGLLVAPPADKDTKDKLEAWYKEHLGYRPSNWKRRPWIKPKGSGTTVKLGDLQNSSAAAALQTAGNKDTGTKFIPPPKMVSKEIVKHFLEVDWPKILGNNSEFIQNPKYIEEEAKEPQLAALMNDKRFVDISSFDMPRMARCYLLSHIGGPGSEFWVAFVDNWLKDNIQARNNLKKQITDRDNTISYLKTELESFRSSAKPDTKASAGDVATPTKRFSLKK